ncbi:hypothetical protein [Bdellovibrio sp. HCB337]|uniref:hypothetical protein n=1 Tax=Bdellovibrio sp. HCB337 TaxID=3394358 RepID=UPI0039A48A21
MENKIQQLVNELSKNERVQAVMHDMHILQGKLNAEMNKTLSKFKKSAGDIEKNILNYRKQLVAQKNKLEKELRAKAKSLKVKPAKKTAKSAKAAPKKATAKKTTAARKTTKKKA